MSSDEVRTIEGLNKALELYRIPFGGDPTEGSIYSAGKFEIRWGVVRGGLTSFSFKNLSQVNLMDKLLRLTHVGEGATDTAHEEVFFNRRELRRDMTLSQGAYKISIVDPQQDQL